MDSSSSDLPERLRTLAANVEFPGRNTVLHRFVIDHSQPNPSVGANYINAVLLSMSDAPASVVNALNGDGYSALSLAVSKHNLTMVKKMLSCLANLDVDAIGWRLCGYTALHTASRLGLSSIIDELLHAGANIEVKNRSGETALCCATRSGHLDAMELLLSKGADVNAIGISGTPLWIAVKPGNLPVIEFLVRNGADVNLTTLGLRGGVSMDKTALYRAVSFESSEIAECLVRNGADVNAREDWDMQTPLHAAVLGGRLENAAFLLDQGADVRARDRYHMTPLHYAVLQRNHVIDSFLDASSACWIRDDAVRRGNLDIAWLLLEQGADLRAIDEEGRTPIHDAVYEEDRKIAAFLSDRGEDPHADRGWMPHYDAEYRGQARVIRKLLERGADVHAGHEKRATPLHFARNQRCMEKVLAMYAKCLPELGGMASSPTTAHG